MSLPADVVTWFTTADHWRGDFGVPHRMLEHVTMSAAAIVAAVVIALPLGIWLGHRGRGGSVAINLANVGRAVPSLAILALFQQAFGLRGWPGFGARPAFVALVALAVPPLLTNAYVGMRGVDRDVVEAARGMGMTGAELVWRVEVPIALPLLLAGLRTAAVQVVATATLAAVTAWGGLGRFIVDGFGQQDDAQIVAGALLVGLLALATELGLGWVQRAVVSDGLRPDRRRRETAVAVATA
ncbi:MAG TPA: ABC transporter permease [Acidimicrobiales bacterium]|nr:ABC transporter permease [Acidimicrobiales bacterium]